MDYDYRKEMANDIKAWVEDNRSYLVDDLADNCIDLANTEEVAEYLRTILWDCDDVTGNLEGYTNDEGEAKERVTANFDLAIEALKEFEVDTETLGLKLMNNDWEYLDVTIRCYLLGEVINEVIDIVVDIIKEGE